MSSARKLTDAERRLIEENHKLIYDFAIRNRISIAEDYDILALGLINAAMCYNESLGYTFSTFAYACMDTAYKQHLRKGKCLKRIPYEKTISYDATIKGAEGEATYADFVSKNAYWSSFDDGAAEVEDFKERLPATYKDIFTRFMNGESAVEIAQHTGYSRQNVYRIKSELRDKWRKYAS